jgi:ABC-type sugar transport system substrate-binding protein
MNFSFRRIVGPALCALLMSCGEKDRGPGRVPSPKPVTGPRVVLLVDSIAEGLRGAQAAQLARLVATRKGWVFRLWDAGASATVQTEHARQALLIKTDFLLVFPLDVEALKPSLIAAMNAGTKVIVFSPDVSPDACTSAIFLDEAKAGRLAAEFVLSSLHQRAAEMKAESVTGRIVELTAPGSAVRSAAFAAAIGGRPGIVIVHQAPCDGAGADVPERIGEALRLQKEFDVIFAHTDLIARRAAQAVQAAQPALREQILVVGTGGALGKGRGVEMVVNSEIDATVRLPPLVDPAWALILRISNDPAFKPKARYEIEPLMVNYETALNLQHQGAPELKLE